MLYYFAYGSNLHPVRLMKRVPSARLLGVAELGSHRLAFHKRGQDGSGKCGLLHTGSGDDAVFGAVYSVPARHKPVLDRIEGTGCGYIDARVPLRLHGRTLSCFTYFAQQSHISDNIMPYHWYKELVLLGARYLRFPQDYIDRIATVASADDPEDSRREENEALINKAAVFDPARL